MWKREAEEIASGATRYVLHPVYFVHHRSRTKDLARIEVPKSAPAFGIHCFERSSVIGKEHQSPGAGHGPAPRVRGASLRIPPNFLAICDGERQQNLLRTFVRRKLRPRAIVGFAWGKWLR